MAAINKGRQNGVDYFGFNSGVLLTILKHLQQKPDVAQELIEEWCKHVSHIFITLCINFLAVSEDNFYYTYLNTRIYSSDWTVYVNWLAGNLLRSVNKCVLVAYECHCTVQEMKIGIISVVQKYSRLFCMIVFLCK